MAAGSLARGTTSADYVVVLPAGTDARAALARAEALVAGRAVAGADADVSSEPASIVVESQKSRLFGGAFRPELRGLLTATDAVRLSFHGPAAAAEDLQRAAAEIASALAAENGGWIHDVWTERTFTAASFAELRPTGFTVGSSTLVHVYARSAEGDRLVFRTQGLGRFGLPEVGVGSVPMAWKDDLWELVDAAAQTLIETGGPTADGVLVIDLDALSASSWRARAVAAREAGGTGRLPFDVVWTTGEDGYSLVVELVLSRREGAGPPDEVVRLFGAPTASR